MWLNFVTVCISESIWWIVMNVSIKVVSMTLTLSAKVTWRSKVISRSCPKKGSFYPENHIIAFLKQDRIIDLDLESVTLTPRSRLPEGQISVSRSGYKNGRRIPESHVCISEARYSLWPMTLSCDLDLTRQGHLKVKSHDLTTDSVTDRWMESLKWQWIFTRLFLEIAGNTHFIQGVKKTTLWIDIKNRS
jgi:hypothetical protein